MRVLYLAASPAIGGGARSLLSLWTGLERAGGVPVVVCPAPGPMLEECRARNLACRVHGYDQPSWRSPRQTAAQFLQWRALLRETQPDVVHANDFAASRAIALATRAAGLPLVCHVRFPPGAEYCRWAFRGWPKPDVFLMTSHAIQRETTEYLRQSCPASRQVVVYNAVDVDVFQPRAGRRDGTPRVGIVANLSPVKRHVDFFGMARQLLNRGHQCEFWVVGDDISGSGYRDELVRMVHDRGLTEHVRFLGFQRDIHAILHDLDVVVSTSEYESFGRSLVEAMAAEIPVVGSAVGGIPEILDDGRYGALVQPKDPDGFANAVERLLRDPDLRMEMGRAGRARVLSLFAVEAHARQVMAVYDSLLSRRSAAVPTGLIAH